MNTDTKEVATKPQQVEVAVGELCPFSEQPCPHACKKMDASQGKTWCTLWVNFQREMKK